MREARVILAATIAVASLAAVAIAAGLRDGGAEAAPAHDRGAARGDAAGAHVRLTDDAIATAGGWRSDEATISVRNNGSGRHELALLRTDLPAGRLPVGLHGVDYRLAGRLAFGEDHSRHEHPAGYAPGLAPGAMTSYGVWLAPGRYVALCNLPGHYLAGEHAVVRVKQRPVRSAVKR